jgi:cell division control protein 24
MSRNASSTSLRSRSTTGDSGPPMAQVGYPGGLSRVPPSRFLPTNGSQPPPLTLLTHLQSNVAASPSERVMNSYFSPVVESPMSSRTSSSSGMYPFPRQATPNGSFHEEHNRFTAPAMGRTASRDGQSVSPVYQMNNRAVQRPSLPAMAPQVPMPQPPMTQNRMRSASSPDIHNPSGQPRRGLPNGPSPHPPMPPFPAHIAHINGAAGINRSQNNSPTSLPNMLPIRSATQSPGVQRERLAQQMYQSQYGADPPRSDPRAPPPLRTGTSTASSVADSISPTMAVSSQNSDGYQAAVQLKVKVTFLDNYVTLVVSSNIKYQSLANRIDHKLARSTTLSIGNGNLRLRYKDEDGDFVTIHSDDDIQMAITDWREQQRGNVVPAGMAEIQLYCQTIEN